MKKRIRVISLIVAVVTALSLLSGCGGNSTPTNNGQSGEGNQNAGDGQTYKMIIANGQSDDYYITQAFFAFEKYVEEASNGRIEVNVFNNGTMTNDDRTTCELLSNGTIHMGEADLAMIGSYVNDDRSLFNTIPYLLSPDGDADRWMYFMDHTTILDDLFQTIENKAGIRVVGGAFPGGDICVIYKGEPCDDGTLKNFAGKRIRVAEKPPDMNTINSLGGNATPMAFGETYTSIQQGAVDGMFTGAPLIVDYGFPEVCNQFIDLKVWPLVYLFIINAEFYDSLPADLQKVVDEGYDVMTETARKGAAKAAASVYDDLKAAGTTITYMEGDFRDAVMNALMPYQQQRLDELKATFPEFHDTLVKELEEYNAAYDASK